MRIVLIIILLSTVAHASMDSYFYTSTKGEMQYDLVVRESHGNVDLKLNTSISPIWAGIGGDVQLNVSPFVSFSAGSQLAIGWNYELFGAQLKGLGLNKRADADDQDDGIVGHGLDGVAYNLHVGNMLQFDWNRVILQFYNELSYVGYTRAEGDELWYFLGDEGMNQNSLQHSFILFAGYAMPARVDLVGLEFSGRLPFYNAETGSDAVRDIGYKMDFSLLANYKISDRLTLMTIVKFTNGLSDPITSEYEREWGFDRLQFVLSWKM